MVLVDSRRLSRIRRYSGEINRDSSLFAYGALTRYGMPFQNISAKRLFCNSAGSQTPPNLSSHDPIPARLSGLALVRFRLIPLRSPLLRESLLLSFPRGTEMFQFPRFPPLTLCVQVRVTPHDRCRVSPFGRPRIDAWSAAPRGFSQPPTSFIGFRRQGIHRWLFIAWRTRCSCSLCNSQGTSRGRPQLAVLRGGHLDGRARTAGPR